MKIKYRCRFCWMPSLYYPETGEATPLIAAFTLCWAIVRTNAIKTQRGASKKGHFDHTLFSRSKNSFFIKFFSFVKCFKTYLSMQFINIC